MARCGIVDVLRIAKANAIAPRKPTGYIKYTTVPTVQTASYQNNKLINFTQQQ